MEFPTNPKKKNDQYLGATLERIPLPVLAEIIK
jgi:hypothetical protein